MHFWCHWSFSEQHTVHILALVQDLAQLLYALLCLCPGLVHKRLRRSADDPAEAFLPDESGVVPFVERDGDCRWQQGGLERRWIWQQVRPVKCQPVVPRVHNL